MNSTYIGDFALDETGLEPPLRIGDLIAYLSAVNRSSKCPHCPHDGSWEIAAAENTKAGEENPKLGIYQLQALGGGLHSAAAMTCPQCGHLAFISTYRIRTFLATREQSNG